MNSKYLNYFLLAAIIAIGILHAASPALAFSFSISTLPQSGIVDQGSSINFIITVTASGGGKSHSIRLDIRALIPPYDFNVAGWAWSDGIGWISFSNKNCDTNNDNIWDACGLSGVASPYYRPLA